MDLSPTYAVPTGWRFPALDPALPDGGSTTVTEHRLGHQYHDGPTHPLARLGVWLRRAVAGATWELSGPDGDERWTETRRADTRTPPVDLLDLVAGPLAGARPREVAVVEVTRLSHTLRDARGTPLGELVDDQVHGVATGSEARTTSWRTLTLWTDDEDVRRRVDRLLREHGAEPDRSTGPQRALGLHEGVGDNALGAYLRRESRTVLTGQVALRRGVTPRHVHRTRVALRRVRSTLRTFSTLLDLRPDEAARAQEELSWLGGVLGAVRDVDVLGRQLRRELADLPQELAMGPLAEELEEALAQRRTTALRDWHEAIQDDRYDDLMALLGEWVADPPVRHHGDKRLRREGKKVVAKARRTAARRLDRAGDDPVALHRARKAVKRARYAADAVTPVLPGARRTAERARRLQRLLGRHQDLVVRGDFLREQAARYGGRSGHNGFAWGLLWARAEAASRRIRERRTRW